MNIRLLVVFLSCAWLSGCAYYSNECVNYLGKYTCGELEPEQNEAGMTPRSVYSDEGLRTRYSHKQISHYVEQMAMKMVNNKSLEINAPIAVASFVQFDSTLNRTNILGNQIAESFIYELQQYHLPVVDYKLTGAIHITPKGDFSFSRDVKLLAKDQQIGYVLSGTLTRAKGGVVVNARIIGLTSKVVVASSQSFIPGFVLNALYAPAS
jgi:TolB-like protein